MIKLLILLLISVPCVADKSLFNPQPVPSEFVLYMPDLSKKFNDIIGGPNKCSLDNYRQMEQIIGEIYIWYHFQRSVDSLAMLNTMTSKLQAVEGEQQPAIVYSYDDALSDGDEVTQDQVVAQLNQWRLRECTFLGKGKKLWDSLRTSKSHDL